MIDQTTMELTCAEKRTIRLHGQLAAAYLNLERGWQFLRQFLSLLHITSKTRRLIRMAEIFELQGEPAMAVEYYLKALARSPHRALPHLGLGRCYLRLLELGKSRESIDRFLEKKKEHPEGTLYRGILLYYGGEFPKALDCLKKAEGLLPARNRKTAMAMEYIGDCLMKMGEPAEAIRYKEGALEMDPCNAKARSYISLGELYFTTGNGEKALESYRKAQKLDPENGEIWNDLGVILHSMGEKVEALDCFERAVALNPGFAEATNNRAAVRVELGIGGNQEREHRSEQRRSAQRQQRREGGKG